MQLGKHKFDQLDHGDHRKIQSELAEYETPCKVYVQKLIKGKWKSMPPYYLISVPDLLIHCKKNYILKTFRNLNLLKEEELSEEEEQN